MGGLDSDGTARMSAGLINYGAKYGPGCYSSIGTTQCGAPSSRFILACVHEHVSPPIEICPEHAEQIWICTDCENANCYNCTAHLTPA